ncbi:hypothetical protein EJB05_27138, partial [Eragrostis curvula]
SVNELSPVNKQNELDGLSILIYELANLINWRRPWTTPARSWGRPWTTPARRRLVLDDPKSDQLVATWMEAFLAARQTGQASCRGSQDLHRHRCRHGSSSTVASRSPHALHAHLPAGGAPVSPKQHDCASSASAAGEKSPKPSTSGATASPPAEAEAARRRRWSSVARSPAATASLLRATPSHAWLSAAACRSRSSSSAARRRAACTSASFSRSRHAATAATAPTSSCRCRLVACSIAARSRSHSARTSASTSAPPCSTHSSATTS